MLPQPVHIVWFKRDLRVTDHRPLAYTAAQGPVLPLYVARAQDQRRCKAVAPGQLCLDL